MTGKMSDSLIDRKKRPLPDDLPSGHLTPLP